MASEERGVTGRGVAMTPGGRGIREWWISDSTECLTCWCSGLWWVVCYVTSVDHIVAVFFALPCLEWFIPVSWAVSVAQLVEHLSSVQSDWVWVPPEASLSFKRSLLLFLVWLSDTYVCVYEAVSPTVVYIIWCVSAGQQHSTVARPLPSVPLPSSPQSIPRDPENKYEDLKFRVKKQGWDGRGRGGGGGDWEGRGGGWGMTCGLWRRQCSGPETNPQTGTGTGGYYNSMSYWLYIGTFSLHYTDYTKYHKGAIAPLYIGIVHGLASIAPIHLENPRFRGNRHSIRNPSSQKGTYGQNMGVLKIWPKLDYRKVVKILKVHFHYSSSSPCCCSSSSSVSTNVSP